MKKLCFFGLPLSIAAAIMLGSCQSVPAQDGGAVAVQSVPAQDGGAVAVQSAPAQDGDAETAPVAAPDIVREPVEMVLVPGGSFLMGSPETTANSFGDERPVHKVTLSAFYMGKYELTQGQWYGVMGSKPSEFTTNPEDGGAEGWKKLPVERVNWYEALVFCNKLSILEGLEPAYKISGKTDPAEWGTVPTSRNRADILRWDAVELVPSASGYRLPTEAQWEYAARGGDGSPGGYTYAGGNDAGEVGWHGDNSGRKTHEAGKKAANNLGLYDMTGNVWEWCWDWYGDYGGAAQQDPLGASSGELRVFRGGDWFRVERSAGRGYFHGRDFGPPWYPNGQVGFRIVRPAL